MPVLWIYSLTRLVTMALLRLYFRIEYHGVDNIPTEGPFLLTPNHVSYADPLWVSAPVRRPMRYMTWDIMTKKPLIGPLMKAYGAFPVNLERADRDALKVAAAQLRGGGGLVVFPEGGRTQDGNLMKFKTGAIRLAFEAGIPVIPATIIGGYEAYSFHHWLPRPRKVRVIFHPPIRFELPEGGEMTKDILRAGAARLQEVVAAGFTDNSFCGEEVKKS